MQSTGGNVFFMHGDVLNTITNHLDRRDLASLLRTSSYFFFCVAPRVWSRVPRIKNITDLVLLRNSQIFSRLNIPGVNLETAVKSLDDVESIDKSRFLVYAPWVKSLVLGFARETTPLAEWVLVSYLVKSHRPLLPYLRELTMGIRYSYESGRSIAEICVRGLLCSSLVRLELFDELAFALSFRPPVALRIMNSARRYAVDLESLHIVVEDFESSPSLPGEFFAHMTLFRRLRSLKCSKNMIDSAVLVSLGACSVLESLEIYVPLCDHDFTWPPQSVVSHRMALEDLTPPTCSFPKLRHLVLYRLLRSEVARLWDCSALVRNLVSADVMFCPEPDRSVTPTIVARVYVNSPHIQELSFEQWSGEGYQISLGSIDTVPPLSLRRLRIGDNAVCSFSKTPFESLLIGLVNLQILELPRVLTNFERLRFVAENLPQLRHLDAFILLTNWPENLDPSSVTPSPSGLLLVSCFSHSGQLMIGQHLEEVMSRPYMNVVARNLTTLWPRGIHCVDKNLLGEIEEYREGSNVALLNQAIRAIQAPEISQVPSYEDCAATWLYPRWYKKIR